MTDQDLQAPTVSIDQLKRNRIQKIVRSGDWEPPDMESLMVVVRIAYRTIKVDDLSDLDPDADKDVLIEILDLLRDARDRFDTLALICAAGYENLRAVSA